MLHLSSKKPFNTFCKVTLLSGFLLFLAGCGEDGTSNVGYQSDSGTPQATADAVLLGEPVDDNGDTVYNTRANTEVVLTGKDSASAFTPVLYFEWKQIDNSGIKVDLVKRTQNTVVFQSPSVTEVTRLGFELSIIDGNGKKTSDTVYIDVHPGDDADHFLTHPNVGRNTYTLKAVLDENDSTGVDPVTVSVDVVATIHWTNRATESDQLDILTKTLEFTFPGSFDPAPGYDGLANSQNPILKGKIPRIDGNLINQLFEETEKHRRIEPYQLDDAVIELTFSINNDAEKDFDIYLFNEACSTCPSIVGSPILSSTGQRTLAINFSDLLEAYGLENPNTAASYYQILGYGGDGADKLSYWLQHAGFNNDGSNKIVNYDAHATYVNNYDLGFGRDMYSRKDNQGNVYSIVTNYPSMEAAMLGSGEFAVVAMEYSDNPDPDGANDKIVKFFAYIYDNRAGGFVLAKSLNFDGRGEKFIPGACTGCHQGNSAGKSFDDVTQADLGATFIPWDIGAFLFSHAEDSRLIEPTLNTSEFTSEEIAAYSREAQEDDIRILNEHALATYAADPVRFAAPIELINGWYGRTPKDNTAPFTDNPTFNEHYVQNGWIDHEELYFGAYAPYCRICHTQVENPSKNFDEYNEFVLKKEILQDYVFEQGLMPLARLSMDRFWVNFYGEKTGAEYMREFLLSVGQTNIPEYPGQPIASTVASPSQTTEYTYLGDLVTIDASSSSFAESYTWSIHSEPLGANTQLLSDSGPITSFIAGSLATPSVPGSTYQIELTITGTNGSTTSEVIDITIQNRNPVAECFDADVMSITNEGVIASIDVIDRLNAASLGDGNPIVADVKDGSYGTVSINPDDKTLRYELNDTFNRGLDTIYYQIQDFDDYNDSKSTTSTEPDCVNGGNEGYAAITIDLSGNFEATPQNVVAALDATDDTETVHITWDAPSDVTPDSYNIYINDSLTPINVPSTPLSFTHTGLTPNTLYKYEITTLIGADESAKSDAANATTLVLEPSNLSASIPADNSITNTINLSWDRPTGTVDGYRLYRDGSPITINIGDLADSDNPSYSDTGLTAGQVYDYSVSAFDGTQESSAVALDNGGKTTKATRAQQPSGLALTLSGTPGYYISADWDDAAGSNVVDSYKLYRSTDGVWQSITTATSSYDGTMDMLAPFKLYSFYVTAVNDDGEESVPSLTEEQMTDPDPASSTKPTWDSALPDSTDDASQIELSWNEPDAYTIDNYTVYRFLTSNFTIDCDNDTPPYNTAAADGGPFNSTGTNYSDTDLVEGTAYTYMITASYDPGDGSNEESACSSINAATLSLAPVLNGSADSETTTTITVDWTAPAASVDSYTMHASGSDQTASSKPYTFTGLSAGTAYNFTLSATQDSTEGGSQTVTSLISQQFTTQPTAPQSLATTTQSTTGIQVSWVAPTSGTPDSYQLQWKLSTSGSWNTISNVTSGTTHTVFSPGRLYDIQVAAVKNNVVGLYSATQEATNPDAPTIGTVQRNASNPTTQIDVSWSAPATGGAPGAITYDIQRATNSGFSTGVDLRTGLSGSSATENDTLTPATTYYYRVRAQVNNKTSNWSSAGNTFTKPIAPTITSITRTDVDQLRPYWSNPTGNETSYRIYYYDNANALIGSFNTGTTRNRLFTGLGAYTTYKFRVSATLSGVESDLSGFSSERTKASITNIEADCNGCHTGATARAYVVNAITTNASWFPACATNANGDCTAHVTTACDSTYNGYYNMCGTSLSTSLRTMISNWYSDHSNNPAANDKNYP
jgi:hypothetical protein